MAIHGNLKGTINAGEESIDFTTTGGVNAVRYGHLKVLDATGKELNASLALNENKLDILVDSNGAIFPLTVDPLAPSPSWTAESDQA